MEKAKILNVFVAITISASGLVGQNPQRLPSDDLKGRQVRMDLHQVTTVNALTSALNAAHVPGGVMTRTTCGAEERRDLTPLGPTLRDALDSIVIANPQYRWYVDKDAVNLVPSNDEPTLLDVVIAEFKVERGKTVDDIVGGLLASPEVKEGANRLQLTEGFTEIGLRSLERPGSNVREDKGFTLHLQNITVREALNAVARTHGSAVWSYQEKRCNGQKEFSISFLVW